MIGLLDDGVTEVRPPALSTQGARMKQPLRTGRLARAKDGRRGRSAHPAKQATAFHGVPAVDLGKLVVSEMLASHRS